MNQAQTATATDHTHMSGFAKKKALQDAGFSVEKLHNAAKGADEWCVLCSPDDGSQIIAADRLQGVAVTAAIEALGGL